MTSCVLEKVDNNISSGRPNINKLQGSQKVAFDCFLKLSESKPEGVHINDWRNAAYESNISPTGTNEAKKKAFSRAVDQLQTKGYITATNDLWRLVEDKGQGQDIGWTCLDKVGG